MITLYAAVSLDGLVAGPGDDLRWLEAAGKGGRDGDYGYRAFYAAVDMTVLGRRTWEVARTFAPWPYGDRPCVVLTRRSGLAPVANEVFEAFDAARWRERGRTSHVYLCGGGEAVRLFLEHGLVDRIELATVPVLLGAGKPLFPAPFPAARWRLRACESHPTGVVQASWDRA
jgi:dihydrofolate reductase